MLTLSPNAWKDFVISSMTVMTPCSNLAGHLFAIGHTKSSANAMWVIDSVVPWPCCGWSRQRVEGCGSWWNSDAAKSAVDTGSPCKMPVEVVKDVCGGVLWIEGGGEKMWSMDECVVVCVACVVLK
eukprot:59451-Amphidinium_carterae.4